MTHRYLNGKCIRCGSLDTAGVDRAIRAELVKVSQTQTFDVTIGDDKNPCLSSPPALGAHLFTNGRCEFCDQEEASAYRGECPGGSLQKIFFKRHDFQEGKCVRCGRAFPQYSEPLDQCPGALTPEQRCAHNVPLSACSTCSLNGEVTAHKNRLVQEQPDPILNERPAVWDLVQRDMADRDKEGRRKYKTPLQPFNGRDALTDAYQEALDLVVYLRQAIFERDGA